MEGPELHVIAIPDCPNRRLRLYPLHYDENHMKVSAFYLDNLASNLLRLENRVTKFLANYFHKDIRKLIDVDLA